MNVNFGLLPALPGGKLAKRERKLAKSRRAVAALASWIQEKPVARLLAVAQG
jgi:folate-dependent tRNA-U54 methylase TrmFO/GidA